MAGRNDKGRPAVLSSKLAYAFAYALLLGAARAAAQVPAHPTVAESVGVNIHFTDARPGEMEMLAGTGMRWIRMDLIWPDVERQRGQYDFSAYDRLMGSLRAHQIRALWILDGTNPLYDQGKFPYTEEGRDAFTSFAVAAVRHFRGMGVLWEMWNEPDDYSRENPKVEVYAKLALAVGKAIRKAAPKETYIGPATSLIDMPFLEGCFKAGLLQYWSAVTVHPYRFKDPESVLPDYEQLRALIARYAPRGRDIPILSGEWGWASVYNAKTVSFLTGGMNLEVQAQLLARQWLTNFASSVPLSIWYDWHDDGPDPKDPEAHCGIVLFPYHQGETPVYTPKPAYRAVRTITEVLGDHRFDKYLTGQPGDYVLAFRRGRSVRFAAWTTLSSAHTVNIPVNGASCSAIGFQGENMGTLSTAQRAASIVLSNAPQYLVCDKGQSAAVSQARISN